MRKLKKTKRIKKQNRIKKTRKLIRIGGGIGDFFRNLFTKSPAKQAHEARDSPVATTLMKGAEPVPFPAPITELQPIKVNTINGDAIYRVKLEGRDYYFFGRNMQYVVMDNIKQIFKLDEDAPDLQKETIDNITEINFAKLTRNAMLSWKHEVEFISKRRYLAEYNILYFNHTECHTIPFNLDAAKKRLIELNTSLQQKCSNLSLCIDYVYNHKEDSTLELYKIHEGGMLADPYDLVLCLYEGKHCISSITIKFVDAKLIIDSYTYYKNKNKKYNILLRCTLILISTLLSPVITHISSFAINPVSAYILITYLGGTLDANDEWNSEFFEFLKKQNVNFDVLKTDPTQLRQLLDLAVKQKPYWSLVILVELSEKNITNTQEQFNKILDRIVC